jgi:hypothetical protein
LGELFATLRISQHEVLLEMSKSYTPHDKKKEAFSRLLRVLKLFFDSTRQQLS